jgi:hypothetical protein
MDYIRAFVIAIITGLVMGSYTARPIQISKAVLPGRISAPEFVIPKNRKTRRGFVYREPTKKIV